ncbi:hypothetical protein ACVW0J_009027 [Bradyrhizobium sp. i1.7.7]
MVWSHTSSVVWANGATFMIPALLTSTSMPPNAVSAASNSARTSANLLMSALTAIAAPPAALIFATSASAGAAPLA